MAGRRQVRTVRMINTSNVGVNEDTRTLWVFGAGASRHLEFPLSFDFFSKSAAICAENLRTYSNTDDIGYIIFKDYYAKRNQRVPLPKDIACFKNDSCLALENLCFWEYLKPDSLKLIPIQELFNLWLGIFDKLKGAGFRLAPHELLAAYPEDLIEKIRQKNPNSLVEERVAYDLESAQRQIATAVSTIQDIYFFTLSWFNDQARKRTEADSSKALYSQLVRSFILEKNARIITFNYDTMLDEAIFTRFTRSWKYGGVTVAGINGYPVATGTPADLVLIKPHGSLNYLICGNCKRAHVNWFWKYSRTGVNTNASGNRRCVFCTEPQPGRRELMGSLTVAPLYDKTAIKKSSKAILEAFHWTDHLVSIGYSFPSQDSYFYELMAQAVTARSKKSPLKISIISHTYESAKEIANRLRQGLRNQGVGTKQIAVKPLKLEGFEKVQAGSKTIPVKS